MRENARNAHFLGCRAKDASTSAPLFIESFVRGNKFLLLIPFLPCNLHRRHKKIQSPLLVNCSHLVRIPLRPNRLPINIFSKTAENKSVHPLCNFEPLLASFLLRITALWHSPSYFRHLLENLRRPLSIAQTLDTVLWE